MVQNSPRDKLARSLPWQCKWDCLLLGATVLTDVSGCLCISECSKVSLCMFLSALQPPMSTQNYLLSKIVLGCFRGCPYALALLRQVVTLLFWQSASSEHIPPALEKLKGELLYLEEELLRVSTCECSCPALPSAHQWAKAGSQLDALKVLISLAWLEKELYLWSAEMRSCTLPVWVLKGVSHGLLGQCPSALDLPGPVGQWYWGYSPVKVSFWLS